MNRTGAFLSGIEWPRTLRYISWQKDMENGFRKKSDIFYDKKAKEERSSTKDYSFLFHNFTKLYGGKS